MHNSNFLAGVGLAALASALFAFPHPADAEVPGHIRHYEVASARSPRASSGDGTLRTSVSALGRTFDLVLEPSSVLTPTSRTITVSAEGTRIEPAQNSLYRGHLADDPDAEVRVSTASGTLDGYVRTGGETYYLEPLSRYETAAEAGKLIAYRASDVDAAALPPMACGAEAAPIGGGGSASTGTRAVDRNHGATTGLLELTLIGDYQFTQMHPGGGAAYLQSIVNQVDGFYVEDLGVTLVIVDTILYTSPGLEPFSTTTNPSDLLDEVAAARDDNTDGAGAGGLTHLVTGRNLDMNVIGIAYIDALCQGYYGSGLSQNFSLDNHLMTLLVGHEVGHNFGAFHDGQSGSPCNSAPYGSVMWPSLSPDLDEHFSTCSIDTIEPSVDAAACIFPAIPPGCGNGLVGIGEECDDGNNLNGDCCRLDCKFSMPGSACQADDNECTDDVCNGLGVCQHPFNNAPCDDGDVCTFDGVCTFGSCQKLPANGRPLNDYKMKASFGSGFDDDKVALKAAVFIPNMKSAPTVGGFSLALRDSSDAILYESIIPPDQWTDLTGNGTNYRFRDDGAAPAEVAGITSMQVKYRPASGVAKIKGKGGYMELQTLMSQPSVSARIQIGDDAAGVCAQALDLPCTSKPGLLTCP